MSRLADTFLIFLGDWSVRWGFLAFVVFLWLTIKPPKRAAMRHALCLAVLASAVLMPISPRWFIHIVRTGEKVASTDSVLAEAAPKLTTTSAPSVRTLEVGEVLATSNPVRIAGPVNSSTHKMRGSLLQGFRVCVVLAWMVTVCLFIARLTSGYFAIRRLRNQARIVGQESQDLLMRSMTELDLSRPAVLAAHPEVHTPIMTGGRHPMILVPSDWDALPEPDRRACLLHELCHLARRDDWIKLVTELLKALVFFHPLAWWFSARLDRERELVCDEEVVARGIDPVNYARLLLRYARRATWLRSPARIHGLSFLHSNTVVSRINRLMEEDMARRLTQPSAFKRATISLATVALSVTLGGLQLQAVAQDPNGSRRADTISKSSPKTTDTKVSQPPGANPRVLKGRVLDANMKPVGKASVLVAINEGGSSDWKPTDTIKRHMLETDQEGGFSLPLPAPPFSVEVFAQKAPYAVAHQSFHLWKEDERLDPIRFRLGKTSPFSMVLVDRDDKPIANAEVRIESLASKPIVTNVEIVDGIERARSTAVSLDYPRWEALKSTPFEVWYNARSDETGSVTFEKLGSIGGVRFVVLVPGQGSMRVASTSLRGESTLTTRGYVPKLEGVPPRVKLLPSARVAGRVTTRLPGVSVAGLTVSLQASSTKRIVYVDQDQTTVTDSEGRFAFDDLYEGTANIVLVKQPANGPWTYHAAKDIRLVAGETTNATIDLIQGVHVEGRVISSVDGRGIPGARVSSHNPMRPSSGRDTLWTNTEQNGVYRYHVPAGEMYVYLSGEPEGYTSLSSEQTSVTATVTTAPTPFVLTPIKVKPGRALYGIVINPSGHGVPGASIVSVQRDVVDSQPIPVNRVVTNFGGGFRMDMGGKLFAPGIALKVGLIPKGGQKLVVDAKVADDGRLMIKLPGESSLEK